MLGTKFLFMPTMDAQNMWDYLAASKAAIPFGGSSKSVSEVKALRVCENGILATPIEEILDLALQYDMVLCTGHIAPQESLVLVKRAREKGLKRIICTHVEWPATRFTLEQQAEMIRMGALLEHNVANIMSGDLPVSEFAAQIKELGAEHMVLSTDLGQAVNPALVPMFEKYVQELLDAGVSNDEMHCMIVDNPARLVE